jgi:hypothetical protein
MDPSAPSGQANQANNQAGPSRGGGTGWSAVSSTSGAGADVPSGGSLAAPSTSAQVFEQEGKDEGEDGAAGQAPLHL